MEGRWPIDVRGDNVFGLLIGSTLFVVVTLVIFYITHEIKSSESYETYQISRCR